MKKLFYIASLALLMISCDKKASYEAKKIETSQDSLSYSFGYLTAQRMASDTTLMDTMQLDAYIKGIITGINEDEPAFTEDEMQSTVQRFISVMQEKMKAEQAKEGIAFLEDNKTKEGVIEIESGIQYSVIEEGEGMSPQIRDSVTVHYTGKFINGEVFDSSVERGQPATFPLIPGGLISGWVKALPLMKKGSKWNVFIPYQEAYGEQGNRGIPPFSALVFEIELIDFTSSK